MGNNSSRKSKYSRSNNRTETKTKYKKYPNLDDFKLGYENKNGREYLNKQESVITLMNEIDLKKFINVSDIFDPTSPSPWVIGYRDSVHNCANYILNLAIKNNLGEKLKNSYHETLRECIICELGDGYFDNRGYHRADESSHVIENKRYKMSVLIGTEIPEHRDDFYQRQLHMHNPMKVPEKIEDIIFKQMNVKVNIEFNFMPLYKNTNKWIVKVKWDNIDTEAEIAKDIPRLEEDIKKNKNLDTNIDTNSTISIIKDIVTVNNVTNDENKNTTISIIEDIVDTNKNDDITKTIVYNSNNNNQLNSKKINNIV